MTIEVIIVLGAFVTMLKGVPSEYKVEMIKPVIGLEGSLIVGILTPLILDSFNFRNSSASGYTESLVSSSVFSPLVVLLLAVSWMLSIAISVFLISQAPESSGLVRPLWPSKKTNNLKRTELSVKEVGQ